MLLGSLGCRPVPSTSFLPCPLGWLACPMNNAACPTPQVHGGPLSIRQAFRSQPLPAVTGEALWTHLPRPAQQPQSPRGNRQAVVGVLDISCCHSEGSQAWGQQGGNKRPSLTATPACTVPKAKRRRLQARLRLSWPGPWDWSRVGRRRLPPEDHSDLQPPAHPAGPASRSPEDKRR